MYFLPVDINVYVHTWTNTFSLSSKHTHRKPIKFSFHIVTYKGFNPSFLKKLHVPPIQTQQRKYGL